MKKTFAFFLALTISLAMLTGCGKNSVSNGPSASNEYHGEGEIQGGIKSDEEIANITEEANSTTEEPTYEDNTGHEPESFGSGNFQDYWEGDDYFDIVAYLKDNGATDAFGTDGGAPIPTIENIANYIGTFYDDRWEIMVFSSGLTLAHVYYEADGLQKKDPHYMLSCPADQLGKSVRVDNYGTTINYGTLAMLDTVVQYMNANPYSDDPLNGSGLDYTNNPL